MKDNVEDLQLAVCLSRAGEEVARIYGVLDRLSKMRFKSRYEGLYREDNASGFPIAGRIASGVYSAAVIAPATSNTVAKIVHGIADTLPTIVASQALKSKVPLLIFPSDYAEVSITHLPCRITAYSECINPGICPYGAIVVEGDTPRIDYRQCRGCERCAEACKGHISCWDTAEVTPSQVDLENLEKLRRIPGVKVVSSVSELERQLFTLLEGFAG